MSLRHHLRSGRTQTTSTLWLPRIGMLPVWIGLLSLALLFYGRAQAAAPDLFFSEYVDGSGENKALEIYNATGASVTLSNYILELYSNGNSGTPNAQITLAGTVANGDVFVIANPNASTAVRNVADDTSNAINFDGNDTLVLRRKNTNEVVDRFGRLGENPGAEWNIGGVGTKNVTLRRKPNICRGDVNVSAVFNPSLEWESFPLDTFNGLGVHVANCGVVVDSNARINEFVFNHQGPNVNEFIEVFGSPNTNYSGLTLLVVNGNASEDPGLVYRVFPVGVTSPTGFWHTGPLTDAFNNGTNTILLVQNFTGFAGMDLDTNNDGRFDSTPWSAVVDDVAVGAAVSGDRTYSNVVLSPSLSGGNSTVGGASRLPNGQDTNSFNDWVRNAFNGQGLGCRQCFGPVFPNEAINTPNDINRPGTDLVTVTPSPTPTGTWTATPPRPTPITPLPANCEDIIIDGGFESNEMTWWEGNSPVPPRFTSEQRRSGLRSMLLGNPPTTGSMSQPTYSSVRQKVTIPADASIARLRWGHFFLTQETPTTTPGSHQDRQEVILLTPGGHTEAIVDRVLLNESAWRDDERDLTAHLGKTLWVYFNVYSNGDDKRTWMYLDDVALIVCYSGPRPTTLPGSGVPTLMPLPTLPPTPIPPILPTAIATPLPALLPEPLPTPTETLIPAALATAVPADETEGAAASPTTETEVATRVAAAASAGALPALVLTVAPGLLATDAAVNGCSELVQNGGFEESSGWSFVPSRGVAAYSRQQSLAGLSSGQLGLFGGTNTSSVDLVSQEIGLPADAKNIVLSYSYLPVAEAAPGPGDLQFVDVRNSVTDQFLARVMGVQQSTDSWQFRQADLMPLAGQPIRLIFAVNNDGVGGRIGMFVDEVSLLACPEQTGTVLATSTPAVGLTAVVGSGSSTLPELSAADEAETGLWARLGNWLILLGILLIALFAGWALWVRTT